MLIMQMMLMMMMMNQYQVFKARLEQPGLVESVHAHGTGVE